jgi:single-stranded DNA-binding protein
MSVNMSMIGRLTREAKVIVSNNNPETELLYMTLAVETHGYKDNQTQQWVQKTEFYDVQLRFKKGMADRLIKNNMFAKGHKLSVKDIAPLQLAPKVQNNKAYANNLFVLLPNANIYSAIEFIDYPHALKSNGTQAAPKQTPAQSQAQNNQVNQGENAGSQQAAKQEPQQNAPKVNPQEPMIDFIDDIPF